MSALRGLVGAGLLGLLASVCAMTSGAPPGTDAGRAPAPSSTSDEPSTRALDPREAQRFQRVMAPLVRSMDDPHINAASAGGMVILDQIIPGAAR